MEILHVIVLALIQGITEFLPISSSAHLILPKEILGWPDQGLAFDVAVHIGTLSAVLLFFRKDIAAITRAWTQSVLGKGVNDDARLAWYIGFATIPASLFGLLMDDIIETHLRSITIIAITTILFGILLAMADRNAAKSQKTLVQLTLSAAIIIGLAQALALIPGTSRSGITITAALFLGYSRMESARFSFLLSIPIILMSGAYKGIGLIGEPNVDWFSLCIGIVISAVSAYLCIYYFLSFLNRLGMMPFVIYRMILGAILIVLIV